MKFKKLLLSLISLLLIIVAVSSCTVIIEPPATDVPTSDSDVTSTESLEPTPEVSSDAFPDETSEPEELPAKIVISELMAKNDSFVLNTFADWVELYNDEEYDVPLDEYYLSENIDGREPFFLSGTVEAGGYKVFLLDDETSPFRLSSPLGTLYLFFKDKLVDEIEYADLYENETYGHDGKCEYITPGFPNSLSGYEEYKKNISLYPLHITEVMSSNKKYAPVSGKHYDWVELYNSGPEDINLGEFYLSDKYDELKRGKLPNIILKPGKYTLIYCSGLSMTGHVTFKISSDGESLYLSKMGEWVVDYVEVPFDLKQNESYGRIGNEFSYMDVPTPGSENKGGYDEALSAPAASLPTGLYENSVIVSLSGEGNIYYTTDGTEPTEKSALYTGPLTVFENTTIRTFSKDGTRTSALASYTYLIGAKHEHPVVEISIKPEWLTGNKGIMTNPTGTEYEYQAYITMLDKGVEMFSAPCGLKLHGNDSKKGQKQNFQIRFRSKYGLGTLDYPLFDDRDYTTFNSLILHGGSEDYVRAGFRDELCTAIVDGSTNLFVLAARPVVLYLNGEYRGIYWLRERFDALYCANNLGVSRESINNLHTYGTVSDGTNKEYLALINFCKKNDLKKEENYKYVLDKIDATSLMDWYICRSYFADRDLANIRFFQSTEGDGKWRWCFFDLDWAFYHDDLTTLQRTMPNNGCHTMILSLLKNDDFKEMFIKRYAELMNGPLSDENINKYIDKFENQFKSEAEADRAKYNRSVKSWQENVQKLRDFIGNGKRKEQVLKSIKSYFSLSEADMGYF